LDVQPFQDRLWGFTAVLDKKNGGGFLDEHYPQAAKGFFFHSPPFYLTLVCSETRAEADWT
jgi:formamidase